MIPKLEIIYKFSLFICALALCFFGYKNSSGVIFLSLALYILGLGYHLLFDKKKSRLFISVFSLFVISSSFEVFFYYYRLEGIAGAYRYLYTVQLFWILGFTLIFLRMLKDYPLKLKWSKWSLFVMVVLLLDAFLANKIIEMIQFFNLSPQHILYSFVYTILKMVLMSIGLIFFFLSERNSRKISFLTGSFLCFFLSDIIGSFNSLFFYENRIAGLAMLEFGFFCIALVFFYIYCISPKLVDVLEKERFI